MSSRAIAARGPARALRALASPAGFGFAVRAGLDRFTGDAVAIVMADGSDDPQDLVLYYRVLEAGYDCAFGSRFMRGRDGRRTTRASSSSINRIVKRGIRVLFRHGYNDTTNAFKAYRREVIEQIRPLLSHHFNLTVEMPLKAIVRGFTYAIVPISWTNRRPASPSSSCRRWAAGTCSSCSTCSSSTTLSRGDYRRPESARRGMLGPADKKGPSGSRGTWEAARA